MASGKPCQRGHSQQQQLHDGGEDEDGDGPDADEVFCVAYYDYDAQNDDELTLRKNDVIEILSKDARISGDEGSHLPFSSSILFIIIEDR